MATTYQEVSYQGWDNCHKLSNGIIDLVVSGDFGPRVLHFGYSAAENLFYEDYDGARALPDNRFKMYGGHRLWHAPEDPGRTYVPDNTPVHTAYENGVLSMQSEADPFARIEKSLDIALDPTAARAIVTHTLTNRSVWPVNLGAWALSVMKTGGTAVLPLPARAPHGDENLQPTSAFVLWSYTDFSDPRWSFASRMLMLYGDSTKSYAQKVGAPVPDGWLAYWLDGTTFVKRFDFEPGVAYPDNGSSAEIFTNGLFLELETLSPAVTLLPGESVEHTETWELTRELPAPSAETSAAYFEWINRNG